MKLISMVDYVISTNEKGNSDIEINELIFSYANFLKQSLELGMFIPCDDKGNVLEEPKIFERTDCISIRKQSKINQQYQEAKERVLFDGFQISDIFDNNNIGIQSCSLSFSTKKFKDKFENKTIEELIHYDITLTESAINNLTNRKV